MEESKKRDTLGRLSSLKEMPKWADRYARNRSVYVPALLGLIAGMVGIQAFALFAVDSGSSWLIVVSIVLDVLAAAGLLWLWFSGMWPKLWQRPYETEGRVVPESRARAGCRHRIGWLFLASFALILGLAWLLGVSEQYWQPLTAICIVPGLLYVVGRDGWTEWPFLLWPVLYSLHALMILAGARLYTGVWYMDVMMPLGGYAVAGMIAAHIYSRYALRRLKELADRCSEVE